MSLGSVCFLRTSPKEKVHVARDHTESNGLDDSTFCEDNTQPIWAMNVFGAEACRKMVCLVCLALHQMLRLASKSHFM